MLRMLRSGLGTDRRSALPWQQSQVSEENRTRQSGTWEAAATAESVKVLGRLHDYAMDERRRQASEKRQGTKSREVSTVSARGYGGISLEAHGSDSRVWGKELAGHGTRGCSEGGKEGGRIA